MSQLIKSKKKTTCNSRDISQFRLNLCELVALLIDNGGILLGRYASFSIPFELFGNRNENEKLSTLSEEELAIVKNLDDLVSAECNMEQLKVFCFIYVRVYLLYFTFGKTVHRLLVFFPRCSLR